MRSWVQSLIVSGAPVSFFMCILGHRIALQLSENSALAGLLRFNEGAHGIILSSSWVFMRCPCNTLLVLMEGYPELQFVNSLVILCGMKKFVFNCTVL